MSYKVYLPFGNIKAAYGAEPLRWLYENLERGSFHFVNIMNLPMDHQATEISFNEKQDMELFILTWGEFLWGEDKINELWKEHNEIKPS